MHRAVQDAPKCPSAADNAATRQRGNAAIFAGNPRKRVDLLPSRSRFSRSGASTGYLGCAGSLAASTFHSLALEHFRVASARLAFIPSDLSAVETSDQNEIR